MVEIKNPDDLEKWLRDQPVELSALIAARAALRVAPILSELFTEKTPMDGFVFLAPMLRAMLNASVAGTWQNADMNRVADAAASAADSARTTRFKEPVGTAAYAAGRAADAARFTAYWSATNPPIDAAHHRHAADMAARVASVSYDTDVAIWDALVEDVTHREVGWDLTDIRKSPLWSNVMPVVIDSHWFAFALTLEKNRYFSFWRNWYQSALKGGYQNWKVLQQIVLLDDDIWKAGPAAIADQIAKIEAEYAQELIPKTILREQVTVLIQNATITQLSGDSLALQIEDAITSYLREEECNGLPEDLSVLEHLPAALRRLTSAASAAKIDESRVAELELSIQAMASEIQVLKDQLEALQSVPMDSPFLKSFKEQSGKSLGDWKMWGAIISGSYLLLGEPAAGTTLAHITETLKSLVGKPPT